LITIGITTISVIDSISLLYSQEIMLSISMMTTTDCRSDELKRNDKCIKLNIPTHHAPDQI
jgi:hypothetical protein